MRKRAFRYFMICLILALILGLAGGIFYIWENGLPFGEDDGGVIITEAPGSSGKTGEDILAAGDEAVWFDMVFSNEAGEEEETPDSQEEEEESSISPELKDRIETGLEQAEGRHLPGDTGYILIGDSRFVGMNDCCSITDEENCFVLAKIGEGYSWFSNTALKQADRVIRTGLFDSWKLIVCLGINDLGNLEKYLKKYEEIRDTYDIILVSVNPVGNGLKITNSQVEYFNGRISETGLPYIDTYHILTGSGFETGDGLHYGKNTYKKIYGGILLGAANIQGVTLQEEKVSVLSDSERGRKNSLQKEIRAENTVTAKSAPDPVSEALPSGVTGGILPEAGGAAVQDGEETESPIYDGAEETGEREDGASQAGDSEGTAGGGAAESGEPPEGGKNGGNGETAGSGENAGDGGESAGGGSAEGGESGESGESAGSGESSEGGEASEGTSSGGQETKDDSGSPGPGYIYVSGQWMNDEMLRNYGLTPEQIERLKRDGHL